MNNKELIEQEFANLCKHYDAGENDSCLSKIYYFLLYRNSFEKSLSVQYTFIRLHNVAASLLMSKDTSEPCLNCAQDHCIKAQELSDEGYEIPMHADGAFPNVGSTSAILNEIGIYRSMESHMQSVNALAAFFGKETAEESKKMICTTCSANSA